MRCLVLCLSWPALALFLFHSILFHSVLFSRLLFSSLKSTWVNWAWLLLAWRLRFLLRYFWSLSLASHVLTPFFSCFECLLSCLVWSSFLFCFASCFVLPLVLSWPPLLTRDIPRYVSHWLLHDLLPVRRDPKDGTKGDAKDEIKDQSLCFYIFLSLFMSCASASTFHLRLPFFRLYLLHPIRDKTRQDPPPLPSSEIEDEKDQDDTIITIQGHSKSRRGKAKHTKARQCETNTRPCKTSKDDKKTARPDKTITRPDKAGQDQTKQDNNKALSLLCILFLGASFVKVKRRSSLWCLVLSNFVLSRLVSSLLFTVSALFPCN